MEQLSLLMKSNTNKVSLKNIFSKTIGYKLILVACSLLFTFADISFAKQPQAKNYIKKLSNGHYQLIVDRKPYIVKGVCYNPVPIGESYEYDWWSDQYKPWLVDGKMMKAMGVNTVRIYQPGKNVEQVKKVIRDLYEQFGIRVVLGNWLGFWEYPCPFYGDKDFRSRIKKEVIDMVTAYKDEPGVLGWILGNENNYSCAGFVNPWSTDEIDQEPDPQKRKVMRSQIYYSFVEELTQEIHKIDINHPVGLGNGELMGLDIAKDIAPSVDFIACIIYRGKTFGNLFQSLKNTFDKPVLLSEIGADCYDALNKKEDQNIQAFFIESQWRQIWENIAGKKEGAGNCLGGLVFEWTDEWWKHNTADPESWKVHDVESNWSNGSYYFDILAPKNMNMNEEWFGIVALSSDQKEFGLDKRIARKSYYVLREFWKNPNLEKKDSKKDKKK